MQLRPKHESHWNAMLIAGEKYVLCHAANHNRGTHFIDLKEHIDDGLLKTFDTISLQLNNFFMAGTIFFVIVLKNLNKEIFF